MKQIIFLIICINQLIVAQQVNFHLQVEKEGSYGIRGNTSPLSWDKSIPLQKIGDKYIVDLTFDSIDVAALEYKYVIDQSEVVTWESITGNRHLNNFETIQTAEWGVPDKIDISNLPLIPSDRLMEDYQIVEQAFRELHPGILRYQTLEDFEQNILELKQAFDKDLSHGDAYLALTKFAASVKCGHTQTGVYNQPNLINQIILEQEDKLPFLYKIIDQRFIITANASEHRDIPLGSEILGINGFSSKAIISTMLPYMSADGSNDAKRIWSMQLLADPTDQVADAYIHLLFPPKDGQYSIDIADKNGEVMTIDVKAVTKKSRANILIERHPSYPKSLEDLWSYDVMDGNIGYLRLGTFGIFNIEMDWKNFLSQAFLFFKENTITNLVIDIRGNEGGLDEVYMELARYLIAKPTKTDFYNFAARSSYQVVPEYLKPYLSTWDYDIYDITKQTTKGKDEFYYYGPNTRYLSIDPHEYPFLGKTYLITDAANSSATFFMALNFKKMGLATLVGQKTGASKKGINAGHYFFLNLPNSQVEIDLPVMSTINEQEIDEGVVPDIYIAPNIENTRSGIDTELEVLMKIINKKH